MWSYWTRMTSTNISFFGEWKYQQISWPRGRLKKAILLTESDINDSLSVPYQNKIILPFLINWKKDFNFFVFFHLAKAPSASAW